MLSEEEIEARLVWWDETINALEQWEPADSEIQQEHVHYVELL